MRTHTRLTLAFVLLAAASLPAFAQPGTGPISGGGGGGGLPAPGTITEAMLKVVNSPIDEACFTYESTTGDFEWQSCGDVVGPASATDNCIATFNSTTGKLIQCNSGLTLADSRTIEGTDVTVGNVGSNAAVYMSSDNRVGIYIAASNQVIGWKKNGASDWRTGLRADGSIIWVSSGDPFNTENADATLFRSAAGVVGVGGTSTTVGAALHLVPLASPPRTCDATAEGDIYSDTSHALCWCDATTWQKLSGAGTCD